MQGSAGAITAVLRVLRCGLALLEGCATQHQDWQGVAAEPRTHTL